MSFTFATPKTDAPAQGGFSFGAPTPANAGGGDTKTATAKPFNFAPTTTTSSPSFGLSFGATPVAPTSAAFPAASTTSGFSLLAPPKTTASAPATGFSLASTPSSTSLNLATTTAAVAPSFSFSSTATPTTTTASLSFSLGGGAKTTTTTSSGFSLAAPTTITAVTTAISAGSVIPTTGNLSFGQLVDAINKWTNDLEEQGKLFSNQGKQLNAWDRLLVSNGEKVLSLNSGIERVKQQQQQLDQELDFVLAQQKELDDLIKPLESELSDVPLTDIDRLHTYQLAENMDTQLKQMSEDLKEIIEQLNESNKNQENSNPITQIRKILNAHMDSLQWIDRHTSKITSHLDQISKVHDLHRKSHEHSLKKTYD